MDDQSADPEADSFTLMDIEILKAILGISLSINGSEQSPLALHLPRYVDWSLQKFVMGTGPQIHDIVMSMLLSIYFFYKSNLVVAWRMVGSAAKACFEIGLHQEPERGESNPPTSTRSAFVHQLFCCVYMWDHRLSFATGLPYTMQDKDIDDKRLETGPATPFLAVMIDYDRINSEVLTLLNKIAKSKETEHQLWEFLDYKLLGLLDRFQSLNSEARPAEAVTWRQSSKALDNLRTLITIRINHARTLLRLPRLQTSSSIRAHRESADVAIECACATISLGSTLIKEAAVWNSIRLTLDFFMFSALATILLVVSKDPQTYGTTCRQSFHEAIDIQVGSKHQLFTPGKLPFTLEQIRDLGERINMPKDPSILAQPQSRNEALWQATSLATPPSNLDVLGFGDGIFDFLDINEYIGWNGGSFVT